jgi:hypothetical protein
MDGTCKGCGKSVLFIREPVYDGFTKTGEILKCSQCGHIAEGEASDVLATPEQVDIFTDADRSPEINLFAEGENRIICRYCVYYVVNPFTQRCARHKKEVQATDSCFDFEERVEEEEEEECEEKGKQGDEVDGS